MTQSPFAVLESRLDAQRQVLAYLIAALDPQIRQGAVEWLRRDNVLRDGQEDPGAVPTEHLAEAMAVSEEFRMILRLAGDRIHEMDHKRDGMAQRGED